MVLASRSQIFCGVNWKLAAHIAIITGYKAFCIGNLQGKGGLGGENRFWEGNQEVYCRHRGFGHWEDIAKNYGNNIGIVLRILAAHDGHAAYVSSRSRTPRKGPPLTEMLKAGFARKYAITCDTMVGVTKGLSTRSKTNIQ